ncbi:DUF1772 domain-containing protein [soil metagenome]
MKVSKMIRFANLFLTGLLAGNELGSSAALHPALEKLDPPERIRAEQAVTRRYAAIMPFWMSSTLISCLAALVAARGSAGFRRTLTGTACFAVMLASTRLGNVPINDRVLELSPEEDQAEFARLRERWDQLHTLRVALNLVGFGVLISGILTSERQVPG